MSLLIRISMSMKILPMLIFVLMLLLTAICFTEANEKKFILARLKGDEGDGSDVRVMLRSGRFARGEIYDGREKNTRRVFIQEAPVEMIIVSNGVGSLISKDAESLIITNEFLVNGSLDMTVKGSWNGKKDGALHMLMGKITMFDYEFDSDSNYPLVFKMTRDGYEYQSGSGRVKDLQTGEIYVLVTQEKTMNEYEEDLLNRSSCEKECCELLTKGQIRPGITIADCVRALCR